MDLWPRRDGPSWVGHRTRNAGIRRPAMTDASVASLRDRPGVEALRYHPVSADPSRVADGFRSCLGPSWRGQAVQVSSVPALNRDVHFDRFTNNSKSGPAGRNSLAIGHTRHWDTFALVFRTGTHRFAPFFALFKLGFDFSSGSH
uniref:(northern house mosquito) hypothetical protein n=1 Tax=Culex pipiens TaxID=7175 RepID=A0A8D8FP52_CULPI